MATLNIPRERFVPNGSSNIYHKTVVLSTVSVSDIYLLPVESISEISGNIEGDGNIEFTNDSLVNINAAEATWVEWDGFSRINTALTAFRVNRNSGTVTAKVTLRTK